MKKLKFITAVIASTLFVGALAGCGPEAPAAPVPTAITLNESSITINQGANYQLEATVTAPAGADTTVRWTTSSGAASVNASGLVSGLKGGYAVITATTVNNLKATCSVMVNSENSIIINSKPGVNMTASKDVAFPGDSVVLTVNSIAPGMTINAVNVNGSPAAKTSSTTYEFVMPNQTAIVDIKVTVDGDVTLSGDLAVPFVKNGDIYEIRGLSVTDLSKSQLTFDVNVLGDKLEPLDLNEMKSFGGISFSTSKTASFVIDAGYKYDFFYDPNASIPFSVQRVGVLEEALPNSVDKLASALITSYAIRSEVAMYSGVSSIDYEVFSIDGTENTDYMYQKYHWNKYANNVAFGYVDDAVDQSPNPEFIRKYVYKSVAGDTTDGAYTVVDTYNKKNGNLTANDDPFRESYNKYGAYSARYRLIEGDDYDYRRFAVNDEKADRNVGVSAHMPVYYVEREIMDSYRVGFEGNDAAKWYSRNIASERTNVDGSFKTTVATSVEYAAQTGGGADASYAYMYSVTLNFDARGALTYLKYSKKLFKTAEWNFDTHTPVTGKQGSNIKKIEATYGYTTPTVAYTSAIGEAVDFKINDYFITDFSGLSYHNPLAGDVDPGESLVRLSDNIYLQNDEGGLDPNLSSQFAIIPSTALDLWQYGPTSSSNEQAIAKLPNDLYYEMSAVNIGTSTVTFTNHNTGLSGGISKAIDIEVDTKDLIRGFYMYNVNDPYSPITDAIEIRVKAGSTESYEVIQTREFAPRIYEAKVYETDADGKVTKTESSYATVTTDPNAEILTIDFSAAEEIQETIHVKLVMESDAYDPNFRSKDKDGNIIPVMFDVYILPKDIDPIGTWALQGYETEAQVTFTNTPVEGKEGWKQGTLFDDDGSKDKLTATFIYKYDGTTVTTKLTSITWVGTTDWSSDPTDYEFVVEYNAKSGGYAIGLAEVIDLDGEGTLYYTRIWGEVLPYEGFTSLWLFIQIK